MIYRKTGNIEKVKTLLEILKESPKNFTLAQFKEILERNYLILSNGIEEYNNYNIALSVICHVADNLPSDKLIKQLLHDNIVKSRVFLYDEMLANKSQTYINDIELTNFDIVGEEFYKTEKSESILTRNQKRLFDDFQEKRRLIVSAPTSFGKSRIVQEIIIHNAYKNILIVLPTIALLNETFVRFKENWNY